mgnify:CR=1 FL=1
MTFAKQLTGITHRLVGNFLNKMLTSSSLDVKKRRVRLLL